ncbi:hypothetical protein FAM22279_02490 [Lacticaseibacillus paracasei]|uniref:hypothetical protein n=1 Tax=Lacticaseibacillus paracasei TaxID=1597 RepID=UPI000FF80592|nr:hypothetical protein [Lacticaseibacillus paracasei]RNE06208.1 hypothetical protein FAM22279_02490 [Lacticaseibacillus paracasei]
MSNETKWDVLEKLAECYAEVSDAYTNETGSPYYCDDEPNYLDEYAAALPDDLPVIPKAVSEWIKECKHRNVTLADTLCMEMRPENVRNWMAFKDGNVAKGFDSAGYRRKQEIMASAWVLGSWRVEETGEVVKL